MAKNFGKTNNDNMLRIVSQLSVLKRFIKCKYCNVIETGLILNTAIQQLKEKRFYTRGTSMSIRIP